MNNQTITFPICAITDVDTGIITAFIADDYSTVTQGTDMDQIRHRLISARNLVDKARKKFGYSKPVSASIPINAGFRNEEITYQVYA